MSAFSDRLTALKANAGRSKSRRLAELYPEIQAARKAGVSRAVIVEALKAEGIDISVAVLSNYLSRLRREAALSRHAAQPNTSEPPRGGKPPPQPSSTSGGSEASESPALPPNAYGPSDPRLIDEILKNPLDMNALARLGRAKKGS